MPLSISGDYTYKEGGHKGVFTGTRKLNLSKDKQGYIESSDYVYRSPEVTKANVSIFWKKSEGENTYCLLYTSDAADE